MSYELVCALLGGDGILTNETLTDQHYYGIQQTSRMLFRYVSKKMLNNK